MKLKHKDIISFIEDFAPLESQEEWDNSGLQIGNLNEIVNGVLLVMDVTDRCVDYALKNNCNLIISHHPLLFDNITSIDASEYKGKLITKIIKNNITVYSSHTNLDKSDYGTNYVISKILNLKDVKMLKNEENIGVIGTCDNYNNILNLVDKRINKKENIIIYGKTNKDIKNICIISGSGSSLMQSCIDNNCDVLITGDIKHHDGQFAYENDLLIIDIGHFESEVLVLDHLKKVLKEKFDITVNTYKNNDYILDFQ